jgi:hypothetical protein
MGGRRRLASAGSLRGGSCWRVAAAHVCVSVSLRLAGWLAARPQVIAIVERILSGEDEAELAGLGGGELAFTGASAGGMGAGGGGGPGAGNPHGLSQAAVMRFIKMVSLLMADQLRTAALASITLFVDFWRQYDFAPASEDALAGYPRPAGAAGAGDEPGGDGAGGANAWFASSHAPWGSWGGDLHAAAPPPLLLLSLQVRPRADPPDAASAPACGRTRPRGSSAQRGRALARGVWGATGCGAQVVEGGVRLVPALSEVLSAVMGAFDDILTATTKCAGRRGGPGAGRAALLLRAFLLSRPAEQPSSSPSCCGQPSC